MKSLRVKFESEIENTTNLEKFPSLKGEGRNERDQISTRKNWMNNGMISWKIVLTLRGDRKMMGYRSRINDNAVIDAFDEKSAFTLEKERLARCIEQRCEMDENHATCSSCTTIQWRLFPRSDSFLPSIAK